MHQQETIKKKEQLWRLEPHLCRVCFGRIVSTDVPGGSVRRYRCSNCGVEAEHSCADALCCCGIKIKKTGRNGTKAGALVDAGVRCIPNPERSPMFPGEYVASEVKR